MTLTKKRFVLKNKKRKTYRKRKTNIKKNKKSYNKKKFKKNNTSYKKKKFRKKRIGGVNINLQDSVNSPKNIEIWAHITKEDGSALINITDTIERYFNSQGFDENDEDEPPPNFSQLEGVFKKALLDNIVLNQQDTDKLEIKVYDSSKYTSPVYKTGDTNSENYLKADTKYFIVPVQEDKIKTAITNPVIGANFARTAADPHVFERAL